MNKVILMGRLTKDPVVKEGRKKTARFTLAVNDYGKEANFINCVAFEKTATTIGQWCKRGQQILIEGSIHTGSYQKESGEKVYTTDVWVSKMEFAEKSDRKEVIQADDFHSAEDESLPFN